MSKSSAFKLPLYVQVIIGVTLGAIFGVVFGRAPIVWGIGNTELGALGMLVIRMLKALAVPLVLFAILDAFLRTEISGRRGLRLILICLVNVSVAFAIGLTLMNVIQPGSGSRVQLEKLKEHPDPEAAAPIALSARASISPLKAIDSYVPESLVEPFLENSVIPVVLLGLLFGAAIRRQGERHGGPDMQAVASFVHGTFQVLMQTLGWVILAVPYAVFGVVAHVVGKAGLSVFIGLAPFLGIVLLGFTLHALLYYPAMAWFFGGKSPRVYLGQGLDAVLTSLSTNSSLATVPVTLRCLTEKMGVSHSSARMAACVGTNLNNDGITLYEAMAALFIAQALGLDLTLGQQTVVVLASLMAGIGIAGIPEAGLVMLPLVLGAMGLSTEMVAVAIAFVLPVDWILARCRSAVNVLSDMLVAILLDRDQPVSVPVVS
ncbi:MAG TPA: dicarboxylate/amino acid:cation symporter [Thermoanaerobaculia bacterium]|jgi:DAACS family dicarboxylate/amino acid:cation (Na+ or H+) symporter|nr:dicarboxylate/amino acid:cation symporter [Thermoanaerobaculia bacterium]